MIPGRPWFTSDYQQLITCRATNPLASFDNAWRLYWDVERTSSCSGLVSHSPCPLTTFFFDRSLLSAYVPCLYCVTPIGILGLCCYDKLCRGDHHLCVMWLVINGVIVIALKRQDVRGRRIIVDPLDSEVEYCWIRTHFFWRIAIPFYDVAVAPFVSWPLV